MGGEVTRLSRRKCQKVAPSCSGFLGAPREVVRPSAARPARASCHCLVFRAGRSSTMAVISACPGFPSEWRTPAGTMTVSPAWARCSLPSRVKRASPAVMMNRSSWPGCTCSLITPPGILRQVNRTSCPSLWPAVAVYWIHSPVAGLKKGRKPVNAPSARSAPPPPADHLLRDRPVLALARDDGPCRQVGQHARPSAENRQDSHEHADQGHVEAEVVGDSRADPRDHPALAGAYQNLGSVHVSLLGRRLRRGASRRRGPPAGTVRHGTIASESGRTSLRAGRHRGPGQPGRCHP